MTDTLSFRVPTGVRERLVEQAHRRNLPDLSSYLKAIVEHVAASDAEEVGVACAPQTQELATPSVEDCPLLVHARSALCARCAYREQPTMSREPVLPATSTPEKDPVAELIEELFEKDSRER